MRTYVRALGIAGHRTRRRRPSPGPGRHGGAPFRRPGGARHPLPRDPHQIGAQPGPGRLRASRSTGPSTPTGVARMPAIYCLAGDTPVLLADGRTRAIADLRPGDRIYGTVRSGRTAATRRPRCSTTGRRSSPRIGVMLEDGTELVASGDHRFLTRRGWKHVSAREHGADRRPHLTLNDHCSGRAASPRPPARTPTTGAAISAGWSVATRTSARTVRTSQRRSRSTSHGSVSRSPTTRRSSARSCYLAESGLGDDRVRVRGGAGDTSARCARIARRAPRGRGRDPHRSSRWPWDPSRSWRKGFLAGIFDAEGSCSGSALRISNTDGRSSDMTQRVACERLGFKVRVIEDYGARERAARASALRGGSSEQLRFFHHRSTRRSRASARSRAAR